MAWLVGHRETERRGNRDATPIVTAPVVDSTGQRPSRLNASGLIVEGRSTTRSRQLPLHRSRPLALMRPLAKTSLLFAGIYWNRKNEEGLDHIDHVTAQRVAFDERAHAASRRS
jgi:hypothetical protein